MLFTVIVLVGTGWSLMKPFLSDRDKKILFVVLPLQVSMPLHEYEAHCVLDRLCVALVIAPLKGLHCGTD